MTDLEAINQEITTYNRRLQKLRLQKATYGISADPSIELEIEDIEVALQKLQAEQQRLAAGDPGSGAASSPVQPAAASKYNLDAPGSQIGAVGDNVTIQGGIHFHGGSSPSSATGPADSETGSYALRKVQALLNDIFSEEELRDFCLYEAGFQPVYDELKDSDRKTDILRRLLSYARQKGLVARLLDWARTTNPARYAAGEPYEG